MKEKIIGIDLGTTNSVVAIVDASGIKVIPNKEGQYTTPSIVSFSKDGKRLVGVLAKRQAVTNPENTFFSIKRLIGQNFDDLKDETSRLPYKTKKKNNGEISILAYEQELTLQEVSSIVLAHLKEYAEAYIGQKISKAVITVPAYFNDAQRQATKDAGTIAGLEVVRIINEPTAAALAYGAEKKKNGTIAVFDFGGGTFDVSILEIHDGIIEVKSTNGDTRLGGDDIDAEVIKYIIETFKKDQGIDISKDKMALQRLKEAAEKAKIELSTMPETEINLPYLSADSSGPKHLVMKFSRAKLESLCKNIFDRLIVPCRKAIEDAKIDKSKIDEVILVGGSTRIPKVQELAKEFFGKEPNKTVNPDEVVAIGAAIQGSVLSGDETHNILLLDVTPLSLGIEVEGGLTARIIDRNTTIPTKKSQTFSTAENNQTAVDIKIVQGERELAIDNKLLGEFRLSEIPAAPRGTPQIEVTFDIDANGIVHVSAIEKKTGKEQKITISNGSGLSKDEIEKMVKEAEEHKEEDKLKRETIETKNKFESNILEIEKTIEDNKEKLTEEEIQNAKNSLENAKKTLSEKAEDKKSLEEGLQNLYKDCQATLESIYKNKSNNEKQNNEESAADKNNETPIDTKAE